jgi:multidrug/hemolysin transport system permease protein
MLPATQITSLIKKTLISDNLSVIDAKIGGVDNGLFVQSMEKAFSVNPYFNGKAIEPGQSVIYILAVFLVSVAAISLIYPRVYKRK